MVGLYRHAPDRELITTGLELGIDRLDTAYNYSGGASLRLLRERAGNLLGRLRISTKVGYFPAPGHAQHDLRPRMLERAVRETCAALGREPEVVLLHNPEVSLTGLDPRAGAARLGEACAVLHRAREAGLCRGWGISSWTPSRLLPYLTGPGHPDPDATPPGMAPGLTVLMLRCGLSVPPGELAAGVRLAERLGVAPGRVWGMSPFGGIPRDPVWNERVTAPFHPDTGASPLQVALRVAFELPGVARVAVGASSVVQLRELHAATALPIHEEVVAAYRRLTEPT